MDEQRRHVSGDEQHGAPRARSAEVQQAVVSLRGEEGDEAAHDGQPCQRHPGAGEQPPAEGLVETGHQPVEAGYGDLQFQQRPVDGARRPAPAPGPFRLRPPGQAAQQPGVRERGERGLDAGQGEFAVAFGVREQQVPYGVLAVDRVPQEDLAFVQLQIAPGAGAAEHPAGLGAIAGHLLEGPAGAAAGARGERAGRLRGLLLGGGGELGQLGADDHRARADPRIARLLEHEAYVAHGQLGAVGESGHAAVQFDARDRRAVEGVQVLSLIPSARTTSLSAPRPSVVIGPVSGTSRAGSSRPRSWGAA